MKSAAQTTAVQYELNAKRVRQDTTTLAALLDRHYRKAKTRPLDSGLSAELEYVALRLEEAIAFLNGDIRTRGRAAKKSESA